MSYRIKKSWRVLKSFGINTRDYCIDVFAREDGSEDVHCIETNPGTDIAIDEMGFLPNYYLIKKRRYSAFFGTAFEILLRGLKVDTLLRCGSLTDVCVHYPFATLMTNTTNTY